MSENSAVMGLAAQEGKAQWAWHLGALAAVIASILTVFQFEVVSAVQVWWFYATYSHCFLIIPIAAWLIWEKREQLGQMTPAVAPRMLLAVPPLLLLWLVGKFVTINELRQVVIVGLIQVAIFTMLGARIYRVIAFPALYLFFLVPFGQYFIPWMQTLAAWFTDIGLTVLRVPHFTEGTLIDLPNGRFEIAEACAGLRFLIATLALGVLFAHLSYRKWYKIAIFLVACVVVPLIGNGFRCIGIIMLAHLTNNELAVGADHLVYGWIFNMAILAVLWVAGSRFRDKEPEPAQIAAGGTAPPVRHLTVLMVAGATALSISAGPAFAYWHENWVIVTNAKAFQEPLKLNGWTDVRTPTSWRPIYRGTDQEIVASFALPDGISAPVDVAFEYYGRNREEHSLIATVNRVWDPTIWRQVESHTVTARLGDKDVQFREAIIASAAEKRIVWSSYWMDGRFTTSPVAIKLLQLKTALTGDEAAALVAVSTRVDGPIEDVQARLRQALASFSDLPQRLAEMGQAEEAPKFSN